MPDQAALTAKMEVRLSTLEAQLKKAGVLAQRAVDDIESKFRRANPSFSGDVFKGALAARAVERITDAAIRKVEELYQQLKKIHDLGEETGAGPVAVQGTMDAATAAGVSTDSFVSGAQLLADLLNDARNNASTLTELFEQNSIAIKNAAGEVIPWETALQHIAELVKNAKTEVDKIDILKAAGLSRDWKDFLEDGADALVRAANAAADPKFAALAKQADEFDKAWQRAASQLSVHIRSGLMSALGAFTGFFEQVGKGWALLEKRMVESGLAEYSRRLSGGPDAPTEPGPLVVNVPGRNKATRAPADYRGLYEKGGGTEKLDAFEREQRRARERIAQMQLEASTLGQSTEKRTAALEALRLYQMAEREEIPITDALRAKIQQQAEAYGMAAGGLDKAREHMQELQEASRELSSAFSDAFKDMIFEGKKLNDVLADMGKRLASRGIDKLFDTLLVGPSSAGGGGIFGALFGGAPKFAGGGMVPGSGPKPAIVHGGEAIFTPAQLRALKGGSGGGIQVNVINNAGAEVQTRERQTAQGPELDIVLDRALADAIRTPGTASHRALRGLGVGYPVTRR